MSRPTAPLPRPAANQDAQSNDSSPVNASVLSFPAEPRTIPPVAGAAEILVRALRITNADGAALALRQGEVVVCQACYGHGIPPPGTVLLPYNGLTGLCLSTGELQACDDTETDTRVDRLVCRQLGIRSVIALPLKQEAEIVGLLEVVCERAHGFDSRQHQALSDLGKELLSVSSLPMEQAQALDSDASADAPTEAPSASQALGNASLTQARLSRVLWAIAVVVALGLALTAVGYWVRHRLPARTASSALSSPSANGASTGVATSTLQPAQPSSRAVDLLRANYSLIAHLLKGHLSDENIGEVQRKARSGDLRAQYELGLRFANGMGVVQDWTQAMLWFDKAANRGIGSAQWRVGIGYLRGIGLERNDARAAEWFKRAASQGHIGAQLALAELYSNGIGVPQDDVRAFVWDAIANGVQQVSSDNLGAAPGDLNLIAARMTPAQLEEANRRLSIWWTRHGRSPQA
jgi:hypothetical protein